MRNFYSIVVSFLFTSVVFGQVPGAFKYQAILRDAAGALKAGVNVSIEINILQGNASGDIVYTETDNTTTNAFGLVNLEIGLKNPIDFNAIDWSKGPHFIRIIVDGVEMGTSQLLSVPYALYAKKAGNEFSRKYTDLIDTPLIPSKISQLENDKGYLRKSEADIDSTNELQSLSISGNSISITKGNSIQLPSLSVLPVLSQSEINGLIPAVGNMVFNTNTKSVQFFDGTKWLKLTGECVPNPDMAEAGPELIIAGASATLNANTPLNGKGRWQISSGTGGTLNDSTAAKTLFYGQPGNQYILTWTISTPCSSNQDYTLISLADTTKVLNPTNNTSFACIENSNDSSLFSINATGYYSLGNRMGTFYSGGNYFTIDNNLQTESNIVPITTYYYDPDDPTIAESLDNVWGEDGSYPRNKNEQALVDVQRYFSIAVSYFQFIGNYFDQGFVNSIKAYALYYGSYSDPDSYNNFIFDKDNQAFYIGMGDYNNRDYLGSYDLIVGKLFEFMLQRQYNQEPSYGENEALVKGVAEFFGYLAASDRPDEYPHPYKIGERTYLKGHPKNISNPSTDGANKYDTTSDLNKLGSCNAGLFPDHFSIRYGKEVPSNINKPEYAFCNSSIISHVLYLMANGGTNRISGTTIRAIGHDRIEKILYHTFLDGNIISTFSVFRYSFLNAAASYYGIDQSYLEIIKAFDAVGIK